MTAATSDLAINRKVSSMRQVTGKAKANTTIYHGTLVNRATSTGLIEPATDAASKTFAGIAYTHVTANGGTDNPTVDLVQSGDFLMTFGGTATEASCGTAVYVVDDSTVDLVGVTTNDIKVGTIVEFVSATVVRVRIDGCAY